MLATWSSGRAPPSLQLEAFHNGIVVPPTPPWFYPGGDVQRELRNFSAKCGSPKPFDVQEGQVAQAPQQIVGLGLPPRPRAVLQRDEQSIHAGF